jgi:hypothetical protein
VLERARQVFQEQREILELRQAQQDSKILKQAKI